MSIKLNNKKSFLLIELIFIILIISLISYILIPKNIDIKLDTVSKRLVMYLNITRFKALIDDKYSLEEELWFKKRWTLKFLRCRKSVGGIYYTIYSDENMSGHANSNDSLKDPLTKKNIYSSNMCKENESNSKYVLLTKNFNITNVEISCNETTSLGQISFGNDGRVYTKLSNNIGEYSLYELKEPCYIKFINKSKKVKTIKIYPKTGFLEEI